MKINYNGNIIGENDPILTIHNRAFRYGDGVYDICKYSYQKLIFWEEHYLRLMAGMRILRMNIPMSFAMEFLEEENTQPHQSQWYRNQTCQSTIEYLPQRGYF